MRLRGVFRSNKGNESSSASRELFIEIVSCKGLLVRDSKTNSSDPYVKIKLGKKDVHETKPVMQSLNPVFTLEQDSAFVLECTDEELSAGLTLKVKDWDRGLNKNDDIGSVLIPAEELLEIQGSKEYKLDPAKDVQDVGSVTIRCRPATDADKEKLEEAKKRTFRPLQNVLPFQNKGTAVKKPLFATTDFSLLIEIVSCWGLLKYDLTGSDPYVKVMYGSSEVHRTKVIKNNLNPIFTVKTDSIFIMDVLKSDFSQGSGLIFNVRDYDTLSKHDDLGSVEVSGKDLCAANGERMVLQLMKKGAPSGHIAIRCRPATESDREFMDNVLGKRADDIHGIERSLDIALSTKGGQSQGLIRKSNKRTETAGPDQGKTKYRIRPEPDPERAAVTEWMTKEEIDEEALKPSRKWVDMGAGQIGRVFIEIIGCDGLPNLDTGIKNKTDPFCVLVFEHSMVKTDVIDDCLSPRWLPWMQRAFVFRFAHPSSNLLLGLFDVDMGGRHELIGRVSINLANLHAQTEYLLKYDLFSRVLKSNRTPKGTVTIRLRIEHNDTKQMVLANLTTPPLMHINVKKDKDFRMIHQVLNGKTDLDAYSLTTISWYVDELMELQDAVPYIIDAAISLLFWRGQVKIMGVLLPLHSAYAFWAATTLAERPSLYPAFFFWGIAWFLLAIQINRNNHAHPWMKARTFIQMLLMVAIGRAGHPETIKPDPKAEEEYKAKEEARLAKI